MKYFRKFEEHADYVDYTESENYLLPNISWCTDVNDIHHEKKPADD